MVSSSGQVPGTGTGNGRWKGFVLILTRPRRRLVENAPGLERRRRLLDVVVVVVQGDDIVDTGGDGGAEGADLDWGGRGRVAQARTDHGCLVQLLLMGQMNRIEVRDDRLNPDLPTHLKLSPDLVDVLVNLLKRFAHAFAMLL